MNSPIFSNSSFSSSSTPTQYTDAIQRAEYFNRANPSWHTMLAPSVKTTGTMKLLKGTYQFALNSDGTCCAFVLLDEGTFVNELFPPTFPVDNSTIIGQAELAGHTTTKDITTLLFPKTYLYENGGPNDCCVLGFHAFDFEPGTNNNGNRQREYVMNCSSWISPRSFR